MKVYESEGKNSREGLIIEQNTWKRNNLSARVPHYIFLKKIPKPLKSNR